MSKSFLITIELGAASPRPCIAPMMSFLSSQLVASKRVSWLAEELDILAGRITVLPSGLPWRSLDDVADVLDAAREHSASSSAVCCCEGSAASEVEPTASASSAGLSHVSGFASKREKVKCVSCGDDTS